MEAAAPQSWNCAVCDRPATTRVHRGCQQKISENLAELPQLYRQLADALIPGRRGGDGRAATRTAPLPCSIDALDLRGPGGIEGILAEWAADLCHRERWTLPQYGTVEAAVDGYSGLLQINLRLLCDEHPAIADLARELRQITGQARRLVTGEKPPIRVPVECPCGNTLRVTLDSPGEQCRHCGVVYGHTELMNLPLAERRAAA